LTAVGSSDVALNFDRVTHWYGPSRALAGLSLQVCRGETVALLGPNGAGKSTIISLLLGLVRTQTGKVEVLGTTPRRAVARGRVGAMLQTGSGSALPPEVDVAAALRLVRNLYPNPAAVDSIVAQSGIGPLLQRRTDQLSGGQAQRVGFALAIAGDPELVFLDEPTAAMDVTAQREFWDMIRQFGRNGRTTVFATHHLREADRVADRVIVVHHGIVVADGPGAVLKAAVGSKRICFSCGPGDPAQLEALEGVTDVEVRGDGVVLNSMDSDATIRQLVASGIAFHGLEVTGADFEAAFFSLTQDEPLIPPERTQ
jgi:ABC-2 type transport system ATP-binding protein